jgi:hypothetical protein
MLKLGALLGAVLALGLIASGAASSASSASTAGIHGAAISRFYNFEYRVGVNTTRTPTNLLAGEIDWEGPGLQLAKLTLHAQPIYLEITGTVGCVVGEVERFQGDFGDTPQRIAVAVSDVSGGPDMFTFRISPSEDDPAELCSHFMLAPWFPATQGGFTVSG